MDSALKFPGCAGQTKGHRACVAPQPTATSLGETTHTFSLSATALIQSPFIASLPSWLDLPDLPVDWMHRCQARSALALAPPSDPTGWLATSERPTTSSMHRVSEPNRPRLPVQTTRRAKATRTPSQSMSARSLLIPVQATGTTRARRRLPLRCTSSCSRDPIRPHKTRRGLSLR